MKPQDPKAESITFGVELETTIPATAGLVVGAYHIGTTVRGGADSHTNLPLDAPTFYGNHWKAERDGSIRANPGRVPCEFVSPILKGGEGVGHLLQFLDWANAIGANVNASCGCHITVGVESIIGSNDPQAMSEFARKLAHIARWHAMSLYGQTGTGRHLNHYSHTLGDDVGRLVKRMESAASPTRKADAANRCGRGMINFKKQHHESNPIPIHPCRTSGLASHSLRPRCRAGCRSVFGRQRPSRLHHLGRGDDDCRR